MPKEIKTNVVEFDLDGTLVNSTKAVEEWWTHDFYIPHGKDLSLMASTHGTRTVETLKRIFPELVIKECGGLGDEYYPQILEYVEKIEADICNKYGEFAKSIAGASDLIKQLNGLVENHELWGIVTSGTKVLANTWLNRVLSVEGVQVPKVFITGSDIKIGKPDPFGYNLGRKRLYEENKDIFEGIKFEDIRSVVFEDAPAGIQAGKASGATVVGILSTYELGVVEEAGADFIVNDLRDVKVVKFDEESKEIILSIKDVREQQ